MTIDAASADIQARANPPLAPACDFTGRREMVGGSGIEPLTFAMSTRRSPAELTALRSKPILGSGHPTLPTTWVVLLQLSFCGRAEMASSVIQSKCVRPGRKQATLAKGDGGMGVRCRGAAR